MKVNHLYSKYQTMYDNPNLSNPRQDDIKEQKETQEERVKHQNH